MESKAFELNLDYTFLATSPDSSNARDQKKSLKSRVSRVVTGNTRKFFVCRLGVVMHTTACDQSWRDDETLN